VSRQPGGNRHKRIGKVVAKKKEASKEISRWGFSREIRFSYASILSDFFFYSFIRETLLHFIFADILVLPFRQEKIIPFGCFDVKGRENELTLFILCVDLDVSSHDYSILTHSMNPGVKSSNRGKDL
jgi:hypothetical protein